MGTKWEYIGSNKNPTHPPLPEKKKNMGPLGASCLTSFDYKVFFFAIFSPG
jgi:hypothetical protein